MTGDSLKNQKCRPVLRLDGLEPEIFYRKRPENTLLTSEFLPRKRLKRGHIRETPDPIGIERLPPDSEPTQEELKPKPS